MPSARDRAACRLGLRVEVVLEMSRFIVAALIIGVITIATWKREHRSGRLEFYRRFSRSGVDAWVLPGRTHVCAGLLNFAGLVCWYLGRTELMFLLITPGMILLCTHSWIVRRWYRRLALEVVKCDYRICPECLYSLGGNADAGACPECGGEFTQDSLVAKWKGLCQQVLPVSATLTTDRA